MKNNELLMVFDRFARHNDPELAKLLRRHDSDEELTEAEVNDMVRRLDGQWKLFVFQRAQLGLKTPDVL